MRGQLMQQVLHSRNIAAGRHSRLRWAVTLVAAGLASAAGLAGAQQPVVSQPVVSQPVVSQPVVSQPAMSQDAAPQVGTAANASVNASAPQTTTQTSAAQPGLPGPSHLNASLGLQAGTLGFGLQAGKLIFSHLGVRAAFNFLNFGVNNAVSDVTYSARLRFQNLPVMVDLFPWSRGSFHFTGGVVFDQNRITGTGQSDASGNITINHDNYTQAQIGTLSAALRYPSTAGYAGIGFGTPARNSLMEFTVDLGAMISTPHVVLNATGAGSNPQLQGDLQAQQTSTQTDVNKYARIYPVISMGLAVRL
jgi:hypothetical protein